MGRQTRLRVPPGDGQCHRDTEPVSDEVYTVLYFLAIPRGRVQGWDLGMLLRERKCFGTGVKRRKDRVAL